MRLLKALKTTGKKIIVVLFNGRPLVLDEVIKNCDALLEAWYPGTMGGKAVAALLTGIENPSGNFRRLSPDMRGRFLLFIMPEELFTQYTTPTYRKEPYFHSDSV